ncbi:response regulator [Saccharopolyspora rosea]|uniref:Response regulator n=1 Tax=Saccharopolyspora rosea TaxID=524884 RepID=A0ABW3FP50_9PSEU|nr:response regulator transcription factor [Saccharopolyspora rosea]
MTTSIERSTKRAAVLPERRPDRHAPGRGSGDLAARPGDPVRVLVVDDHPVVREGAGMLLAASRAVRVVGGAGSGAEAIELAATTRPDVVLLDLRLRDLLAPEVVAELRRVVPGVRVVIFTAYPEHAAVRSAIDAGAQGVLLKDSARSDIVGTVLAAARGGAPRPPARGNPVGDDRGGSLITAREYDVLRRVAVGESNPEIAEAMFLSRNTVKSYLQNACRKLGARNRVEAIAKARDLGLL